MKISEIVGIKRKALKLSQRALAQKISIRQASISDFETGKASIGSKTLEKIFEILKIKVK